ncbi:hypothetical protein [Niveibacterium sp. SC-1]|uniref:hypothetical protein n=1 Tax=Niveibacterium sp. SC-1 TaxID=3135646 RepID=UPI00311ED9AD
MIKVDIVADTGRVVRELGALGSKQIPFATAKTLTAMAKAGEAKTYKEMATVFDRPTPFTLRSLVVRSATKARLEASVGLKDTNPSKQGKTPADILGHEFTGGQRRFKGLEGALRRMGYLGTDWAAVPGEGAKLDAYGNLSSGTVVQLMSYLKAFGEQGYSANKTAKGKARVERRGKSARGFATIGGVAYFVSRGKGAWFGGGSWQHGRRQNLAPGIWAKSGIHGSQVKCIVAFVRTPVYRQRIHLQENVARVVSEQFEQEFRKNLRAAMADARA